MTLDDILSETPIHKFYMQRAPEKVREDVLKILYKEAFREGSLLFARQLLLTIFQERFPQLSEIAEGKISQVTDSDLLKKLILMISPVQTVEQAAYYLLIMDYPDKLDEEH